MAVCILSIIAAVPLYLFVEKPFANILNLILFPAQSIFSKKKDLEDDSDTEEEEEFVVQCNGKTLEVPERKSAH